MNQVGVRKTTMDSVATHLSMSKRTIYEIFENKNDLVRSVIKYLIKASEDSFSEIKDLSSDTFDGLLILLNRVEKEFSRFGRITDDVKLHYPEIFEEEFVKHYENTYKIIYNGLESGIENGDIMQNINLNFAVFTILETVGSIMQNQERMVSTTKVSPLDAFKYVVVFFMRGISTQQGIQKLDKLMNLNNTEK